jgi:hypothetical protein
MLGCRRIAVTGRRRAAADALTVSRALRARPVKTHRRGRRPAARGLSPAVDIVNKAAVQHVFLPDTTPDDEDGHAQDDQRDRPKYEHQHFDLAFIDLTSRSGCAAAAAWSIPLASWLRTALPDLPS